MGEGSGMEGCLLSASLFHPSLSRIPPPYAMSWRIASA